VTRRPRLRGGRSPLLVLRRHWRLVAVVGLLGLAVAVVWSLPRTAIYESTAAVLVAPTPTPTSGGGGHSPLNMRDEQQVVRSVPVARIVARRFRASATPEQLLRHVSVEASDESRILRITYADPGGATATTGAGAFASAYLEYRRQAVGETIHNLAANLTREIADLTAKKQAQEAILAPDRQATSAERDAALTLREAYGSRITDLEQQLRALRRVDVEPGSVLQPATPPSRATGSVGLSAALGLALGLLLGAPVAFVHDRTDRRLRGHEELAELLDRPVLTPIPPLSRWPRSRLGRRRQPSPLAMRDHTTSPAAEAYRVLQARVSFLADQLGVTSIMVTSAGPDEGKSTTAANLALALTEAGRDVLLISADLRRPRIHRLFNLPDRSGLGEVLADMRLGDGSGPSPEVEARMAAGLWSVTKHLWVLVSRPAPPEATALLGSDAMRRLLETQRRCFDFVILDCPPMLVAADALALAPLVDAVLVVADRPSTGRQELVRLREQLEQVGGKVLGAVLNRDRSQQAHYQYGA
jgi:capsular exopolysaccharide synthesis family protein